MNTPVDPLFSLVKRHVRAQAATLQAAEDVWKEWNQPGMREEILEKGLQLRDTQLHGHAPGQYPILRTLQQKLAAVQDPEEWKDLIRFSFLDPSEEEVEAQFSKVQGYIIQVVSLLEAGIAASNKEKPFVSPAKEMALLDGMLDQLQPPTTSPVATKSIGTGNGLGDAVYVR